ncbi:DUF1643 domain-containing protein [Paenibacillus sp. LS1]|uniref:DUF1643 domain-containing protein n=1 Tax=Paenibacillus sp. LS1 TaxID=2992120 RepID=UPI00222F1C8D|nr:DUF1643 domain-containing protein [Paenibacillus sp. LS1]MCW3792906.1 DUF1643 domain-containing protein [Paenibacillus sp. LS1]
MYIELSEKNNLKLYTGVYHGIQGRAVFNKNISARKRYFLEKRWREGKNILTAIMMNPSNAAHDNTDDTVDQLIEVAQSYNYDALYVVNVSSFIGGSSSKLNSDKFVFDKINWRFIEQAMKESNMIFIGWGMKGQKAIFQQQKANISIFKTFMKTKKFIYTYEFMQSKNKVYLKKPFYYVPHPRPIRNKEKYKKQKLYKLTHVQLNKLLIR